MSSTDRSSSFLSYVHSLRGLAILFVVTTHVGEAEDWQTSPAWMARLAYALLSNATVPFMFVSGFLFQHLSERFTFGTYLNGRLKRLALPYILVSIPTLIQQQIRHNGIFEGDADRHPLVTLLTAYGTGGHMPIPFWYIPVIILLTLAAPLFVAIDRRPASYWLIVPTLLSAMALHRSRGHHCVWQSTLYFLPVYLVGMWSSHYREEALAWIGRLRRWLLAVATALFLIEIMVFGQLGAIYSEHPFSTEGHVIFDLDLPVKTILTLLLLEWLYRHDTKVRDRLAWLGDVSFGMFFLHEYVIRLIKAIAVRTNHDILSPSSATVMLLSVPTVVAATMLAVWATQQLLGARSRIVIGS